jgi:hypothetical protein
MIRMQKVALGLEEYPPLGAWGGVGENAEMRLVCQICVKYSSNAS